MGFIRQFSNIFLMFKHKKSKHKPSKHTKPVYQITGENRCMFLSHGLHR